MKQGFGSINDAEAEGGDQMRSFGGPKSPMWSNQ
jgi:hypothetical protein